MLEKLYSYFSRGYLKEVSKRPKKAVTCETLEDQPAQTVSNTAQLASSSSGNLRSLDRQARWVLANGLTHPRQTSS